MALEQVDRLKLLLISDSLVLRQVISQETKVARALTECVYNLLHNQDIQLSAQEKTKFKKYKSSFLKLLKGTAESRRRLLTSKTFLPIIPVVLQVVLPYLNDGVKGDDFGAFGRVATKNKTDIDNRGR